MSFAESGYNKTENRYEPLYLSYRNDKVEVSTERALGTRFKLESIVDDWKRFGSIYTDVVGWTDYPYNKDKNKAMKNYENNKSIGIKINNDIDADITIRDVTEGSTEALKHSNIISKDNYNLLYAQYAGNFPKMKFSNSKMSHVCCEIMATYNALALVGEFDINYDGTVTNDLDEYFKLALEFEINDIYLGFINSSGSWGSDPKGIEECLKSYNCNYKVFNNVDDMDKDLSKSVSMIVSYKFKVLGIHTYSCYYDDSSNKIYSINRGSGNLYLWENNSIQECISDKNFSVGYVLQ